MNRAERGVVLTLLGLGVAGHAVGLLRPGPGASPGAGPPVAPATALARQRARVAAAARPLRPGERLDPDRASAEELDRLPGIGMRLAKEMVADRAIRGPFGSPGALERVPGIGPATVRRLEPFLLFGRPQAPPDRRVDLNRASLAELETLPGIGPSRAQAILAYRDRHGPFRDVAELVRVPGVGPHTLSRLAGRVAVR